MSTFRKLLLLTLIFLSVSNIHAQWIPQDLQTTPYINENDSNRFTIDAEVLGFFKNNEYFSPISKGETFPGIRFMPKLGYQLGGKFRAEIGTIGMYYSGDQQKDGFEPFKWMFARLQYAIQPNLNLTLGNYYGGVNHRLIEPLYKWERHYTAKPESGIQLMYEDKKYFADVWVDWERFIERGDTVPEILTFGVSASAKLSSPDNPLQFSIPLQLVIHHQGGQIDESSHKMVVAGNIATGICSELSLGDGFIKSAGLNLYAVGYYDKLPHKELRPYSQGLGIYPVVLLDATPFKFMAGYWHSKKFFSYGGDPLFASFNLSYPGETIRTRNLVTTKVSYSKKVYKGVSIGGQAEIYTDLDRGEADYSFGVHMRFDCRILK